MIPIKQEPDSDEHLQKTPELGDQKKTANEKLKLLVDLVPPAP